MSSVYSVRRDMIGVNDLEVPLKFRFEEPFVNGLILMSIGTYFKVKNVLYLKF